MAGGLERMDQGLRNGVLLGDLFKKVCDCKLFAGSQNDYNHGLRVMNSSTATLQCDPGYPSHPHLINVTSRGLLNYMVPFLSFRFFPMDFEWTHK